MNSIHFWVLQEEPEEEKRPRKPAAPRQEFVYEMATDMKAVSVNDPTLEEKYKKEAQETATSKFFFVVGPIVVS